MRALRLRSSHSTRYTHARTARRRHVDAVRLPGLVYTVIPCAVAHAAIFDRYAPAVTDGEARSGISRNQAVANQPVLSRGGFQIARPKLARTPTLVESTMRTNRIQPHAFIGQDQLTARGRTVERSVAHGRRTGDLQSETACIDREAVEVKLSRSVCAAALGPSARPAMTAAR